MVGNPPYFNMSQEQIEKKYAGQDFDNIATGVTNIAALFLKKYITLLEPNGYLGFVVPKSLTYSGSWEGIRKFILDETEIVKVIDVHEAFEGVLLEQVAIILQKKPSTKKEFIEVQYIDLPYTKKKTEKHKVATKLFTKDMFPIYCFNINNEIKNQCLKNAKLLDDISKSPRGLPIQKFKYLFTDKPSASSDKRIIRGDDIEKYKIKNESFVQHTRAELNKYSQKIMVLDCKKIVVQNIVAQTSNHLVIIAAFDDTGAIDVDTVNNIILNDNEFDYKYILGFLNSRLAEYYAFNFLFNRAVRTMHFETLRQLPIKIVSEDKQKKVADLVDKLLGETQDSEKIKLRAKIDEEFYSIYGLKSKEIALIEKSYAD